MVALVAAALLSPLTAQAMRPLPADCAVPSAIQQGPLSKAQIDALRAWRIEDAARVTGSIVDVLPHPEGVVTRLSGMTARSSAIVIGTVRQSACYLASDGRLIATDFQVQVEEAVKGDLRPGEGVVVQMRGGRVVFDGSVVAETRIRETVPLRQGARYVLFLRDPWIKRAAQESASAESQRRFGLTNDGYSVFELAKDGKVVPALTVSFGNNVSTDNRGRPVEEFLAEVRTLRK